MAQIPPSTIIKDLVSGYASLTGYGIELGTVPPAPDKVICITDTTGLEPNPRWLLDYPSVQVWVRGINGTYDDTWVVARNVKDLCLGIASYTHDQGDRVVAINLVADIAYLGMDENSRPQFTVNFALIIEPAPSANTHREPL